MAIQKLKTVAAFTIESLNDGSNNNAILYHWYKDNLEKLVERHKLKLEEGWSSPMNLIFSIKVKDQEAGDKLVEAISQDLAHTLKVTMKDQPASPMYGKRTISGRKHFGKTLASYFTVGYAKPKSEVTMRMVN